LKDFSFFQSFSFFITLHQKESFNFSSPFIKKNFSILHHSSSKRIFQFFITLHQKEFFNFSSPFIKKNFSIFHHPSSKRIFNFSSPFIKKNFTLMVFSILHNSSHRERWPRYSLTSN